MCGLVGVIGDDNLRDEIFLGLHKLEYRGYDSAGIGYIDGGICTIKCVGGVDKLQSITHAINSKVCIAHTRWATHGGPSVINCHPHVSAGKSVCIVHNGIIENCDYLKNKYNINCVSDTDTEIVATLIEIKYLRTKDKLQSINEVINELKGSFALAILFDGDNSIYFARNISPLLIGFGKDKMYLCSDVLGMPNASKYIDLPNLSYGYITLSDYKVYHNGSIANCNIVDVGIDYTSASLGDYPHYMLKEIYEIPKVLKDTISYYVKNTKLVNRIKECVHRINKVVLIACGTSYHACLMGEKFFNEMGYLAYSCIASEFVYDSIPIDKNTLCILVSQSGETADTISALAKCKKAHCKTLCITNVVSSTIAKNCKIVMPIKCGPEIAVASTKAYNAQVLAMYVLQYIFKNKKLSTLHTHINKLIKLLDVSVIEKQSIKYIKHILSAKNIIMIGKNADYVSALEASLKFKEISYISSTALPCGELKHGTLALVDEDTLVIVFDTISKLRDKTSNIISQIKSRGGKILVISNKENNAANYMIALPNIKERFLPLVSVIPMQLISYKTCVACGYNPDKPRNLAKSVTVE
ncbi:MAG: glutamine--fructose-6-phosphate transaminase (isomerizing) [Clostridia bacterium]|nr:glutamine--fructose-6-phosphate transaminase (isomerizing) [Clostridia bacterium]